MAYSVDSSRTLRERMRQLLLQAQAVGQFDAFQQGLLTLHARLTNDPHAAGEIKYHTPTGFPVYSAASAPAAVSYVVYESRQAVSLIKIDRMEPE